MNMSTISNKRGFTLLEVVVAITVLSFIMGIVYKTFATVADSNKRGIVLLESDIKVRNLAQFLTKDLSSIFIDYINSNSGTGISYGLVGSSLEEEGNKLNFTALSTESGSFSDAFISEVGYFLQRQEGEGFRLMKRIDKTPDDKIEEGGQIFEIIEGLKSLSFEFLDDNGNWISEWDSFKSNFTTNKLPKSIKIIIAFSEDEEDKPSFLLEVPVFIGAELS